MPERKDRGTITKFVIVAWWSNFSAHKPDMMPIFPKINEVRKVNKKSSKKYYHYDCNYGSDILVRNEI